MYRRRILFGALALAGLAGLAIVWAATRPPIARLPPALRLEAGGSDISGFARALAPRDFEFPRDHGPHFDFQTEWWYYTGNLDTSDGRHVGYQLTFFRRGLTPGMLQRSSVFGTNQVFFAHFTLSDVAAGRHTATERFSRGAAGLAGASGDPYRLWIEDWRAESVNADGSVVHLSASADGLALDLTLRALKPVVAHGDRGLSPKSAEPGNASYYLSFTRMETTGQVTLGGRPAAVTGLSWFDHEWSTSALGPGAVGWDWFGLQLSDGREIMYGQIRHADGTIEPVSGGTLVEPDGQVRRLALGDVELNATGHWRSPQTGAAYPGRWRLAIPSASIALDLQPYLPDQENRLSFVYWEGAVQISGTSQGASVAGSGYVELTGYLNSIAGQF